MLKKKKTPQYWRIKAIIHNELRTFVVGQMHEIAAIWHFNREYPDANIVAYQPAW